MIKEISSKTNPKIKMVCSLKDKKYRNEYSLFVSEGKNNFEMALEMKLVKEVYVLKEIKGLKGVEQYLVTKDIMEKISSQVNPEGIVAVCHKKEEKISEDANKLVYLDNINDPGNMGTLIRTALALGYDGLVYSSNSVDIYNEKVIASSKGAIFKLPLVCADDIKEVFPKHKIIVSALSNNSVSLDKIDKVNQFILVLGNETHGVRKELLETADYVVKIPMNNIDSLNVAVAGGILMYELQKI